MFDNDSVNINHPVEKPGTTLLTGGRDSVLENAFATEAGELFITETTEETLIAES